MVESRTVVLSLTEDEVAHLYAQLGWTTVPWNNAKAATIHSNIREQLAKVIGKWKFVSGSTKSKIQRID